ncbi:helix-turn-helix transcriptional regulator [Lactobacillus sp. DCY120]|uniref:Helix-turn-helix transcriptional regulator n=1 Tax=Bombilactobacillus apium TaxID=2675299 RepID=A0A850R0Q3_9LACO|nr:helix-turn-helix transcriptional regulator [Bombilactobacillus apium]NVY95930.1 helix-turn-helix transcriptional regulator [Bombilactobacillus apium]
MTTLDLIKKFSRQRGWSLQTLAEKAGLGKNSIYRWNTKTPSTNSLKKIAKVLQISIEDLFGDDLKEHEDLKSKKIDITKAIHEGEILAYEGQDIPPEEVEMIRRIIEGRKHNG